VTKRICLRCREGAIQRSKTVSFSGYSRRKTVGVMELHLALASGSGVDIIVNIPHFVEF